MCPKVSPNFDHEPPAMRAGEHVCVVVDSILKYGQESGTPYINWKLKTTEDNRVLYYTTPIEGRGAGMFKHFVHRAGDPNYQNGEFDTTQLHGNKVFCDLIIDNLYYKIVKVLDSNQMPDDQDLPF